MSMNAPLRILQTEAATDFGGQEQYIHRMMHILRDRGHMVEAVCQPHAVLAEKLRQAGFGVHVMPTDGPLNYLSCVSRIRKILRAGKFDVVNSHSRRDTMIAAMAGRLAGTPVIVRTRHLAKPPKSLLSYNVLPKRVITPSEAVRKMLLDRGVPAGHVAVVYPVVDAPELVAESSLRPELGLGDDAVVVGCVGAMRPKKGQRFLLQAMQPLFDKHPLLHLVFVGGGSPIFEQLQDEVTRLRLQHRVHLLGTRPDVPNLLAGFDIFALATEQEASGTVFVEASAAALPVVGTAVDGVPEMFTDTVSGLLVPPGDMDALTRALDTLISDPALRRKMGDAGRRLYLEEQRFTPAGMGRRVEQAYRTWLEELRG